MARDQVDMTPIETREELIAWFEAGSKPKSQFRIGTEHEKFVFTVEGHNPVPYDGSRSIRALLEGMQHLLGWEPIIENGNIIGLFDVTSGGAISLEPGGQFELSGAPLETVHQTCSELMAHLAQVKEIARPLGIVAARSAETLDEASTNRIGDDREHDRHGARRTPQWPSGRTARREDDVRSKRHQFRCVFSSIILVAPGPTVVDLEILPDGPAQLL
jgi:hypothetical protein